MPKKTDKKAARKERRDRRAKRNQLAVQVTSHLIAPSLKPAQLKKLLDEFAKLEAKCKKCGTPIPKRKGADLCERCSQDDSEGR